MISRKSISINSNYHIVKKVSPKCVTQNASPKKAYDWHVCHVKACSKSKYILLLQVCKASAFS